MPTIKDKLYFNFGGTWSSEFGLMHVVLDSGMYEETFGASRDLNETKVRGNPKPMLHSVEESPLEFDMVLAFEGQYTDQSIDKVVRWLFKDYYRPLYFEGGEGKVYNCILVDDSTIVHNGLKEGYVRIRMRCDSPNTYSPYIITGKLTVTGSATLTVNNDGHFDVYPEISIKKLGAGSITIESLDDFGSIFEVRDLTNQEDLYINCEKEIITTDIIGVYRFDNVIGDYPRIVCSDDSVQENRFKITGDCEIQFRFKNRYRF